MATALRITSTPPRSLDGDDGAGRIAQKLNLGLGISVGKVGNPECRLMDVEGRRQRLALHSGQAVFDDEMVAATPIPGRPEDVCRCQGAGQEKRHMVRTGRTGRIDVVQGRDRANRRRGACRQGQRQKRRCCPGPFHRADLGLSHTSPDP
jgi:hypothetical protein